VLAALAALAIVSCGGGTHVATTIGSHTFVDLVDALPANLDETGTPDVASTQILPNWMSELVRPATAPPGPSAVLPPDDAVVPYLATSWHALANGDYVFELRHGVRGATGDPFTATDVRWSLERAVARSPVAPFLFRLARIDAADPVTILSPHSVRINVRGPSPFTLSVLADPDAAIYDSRLMREHASGRDPWAQTWGSTHSATFAAYYVASYLPNREIVLAANPGFWRPPYYTRVLIKEVGDGAQRVNDVLAGTATHTASLDWGDFATAVDDGPADGVSATVLQNGPGVIAWHLNVRSGPLANPQVRQAINLGIDRTELASGLSDAGYATPSVLAIPAAFGQSQPTVLDPVQARSLMRAAGYPHAIDVTVYTNDTVTGGESAVILSTLYKQLLEIDITLHVVIVENTDQLFALEDGHTIESSIGIDMPLLGGAAFLVEQDANTSIDPVSPAADEGYRSSALSSTLDQLLASAPGTAADTLAHQAATTLDTDLPTINLVTVPVQNVTRANVVGYRASTGAVTYYENLRPG
jgi:peptide/nickel transport system substrate-binding protein